MLKKLIELITIIAISTLCFSTLYAWYNQDVSSATSWWWNGLTNTHLSTFDSIWWFFWITKTWASAIKSSFVTIAKDLKNLFFVISTIFFFVITLKLLFSSNTEDEFTKYKKWIIWITVWLVVMQLALWFVIVIFDSWGWNWTSLAFNLSDNIINPLIKLLETLASIFFLWIAIYSFVRLVSAWGNEERVKSWKNSIIYALIGFWIVILARKVVETIYWFWKCNENPLLDVCLKVQKIELSKFNEVFLNVVNWANSFIAIITLLMVIYAWFILFTSGWDEEKLKKVKKIIIYVALWVFVIIANYLIITLFIIPESTI